MSKREDERVDDRDALDPSAQIPSEIPSGFDRRKFIMRSAVISAAAVMNGCARSETERTAPPPAAESTQAVGTSGKTPPAVPLSPDLDVVKKGQGPVLTTLDEGSKRAGANGIRGNSRLRLSANFDR